MIDRELLMELQELHEQLLAQDRKIAVVEQVLMGPPPAFDNGIRGDVKAMEAKLDAAIAYANDLWHNKRPAECLGIEAVAEFEKRHEKDHDYDAKIKAMADGYGKDKAQRMVTLVGICLTAFGVLFGPTITAVLTSLLKVAGK